MATPLSMKAIGHATSLFIVISYILCIIFDLIFPQYTMYQAWQHFLPGFEWLTLKGFTIGLVEAYGYGWFFALIWTPLYNVFLSREAQSNGD